MKNVTIRNESGERVAFYRHFPATEGEQLAMLREDLGAGVYKVCYQKTAKKLDKNTGKAVMRTFPVKKPIYVDGDGKSGSSSRRVIISSSRAADVREGLQTENSTLLDNLIEAIQAVDQNVSEMRDELADIRAELFEEEEEGGDGSPEEKAGITEKLAAIALNPKYAGLVGGLMNPGASAEQMAETVGSELNKNPAILKDLVMELLQ